MKLYQLTITAHSRPETLERILRVVRHRGFHLTYLLAEQQADYLKIQLSATSTKEISLLITQLDKLEDVCQITQ